ncbi:MAG: chemotaxis protein CheB [Gammaproteobacteria bacterium]
MAIPIVAIGASAGGLEAISELLAALPAQGKMAYVLVQHLDPAHTSLLPELLAKKTGMPVVQIEEGLAVQSAHVYVIPPNATLTLDGEHFHLERRPAGGGLHLPIDALFVSLAEQRGSAAIGVVLSGGNADGSRGVRAVKHAGGITFAQQPQSARFPDMPRNAIETGCIDFVLRPEQIAQELGRLGNHPYVQARTEAEPTAEGPDDELAAAGEEENLRRIFRRLRSLHGVDFSHYKRSTLHRRLLRRMALRGVTSLADYLVALEGDEAETAELYQDFLIRVTQFFREPKAFEGLSTQVFPRLCEGRGTKDPIRIWVPGCATGEEVYSIAIALVEHLGDRLASVGVQIFGTDVSETSIELARAGVFPATIQQDVSSERLSRFFVKQDGTYVIAKSIRDLCIFARQDVTRDPPFSRLDLVSCRNLLIYLDASTQRRVMHIFHYALRSHAFLVLGPSETVGTATDLFELSDSQLRLYTRKAAQTRSSLDLTLQTTARQPRSSGAEIGEEPGRPDEDAAQREADRLLLSRYAPASVVVDEALNIIQFRGETAPYLEHASGPPSLNLQRVARSELLIEITPAIQEARDTGREVRREGLSVNGLRDVTIEVIPLRRSSTERCYLILFEDGSRHQDRRRAQESIVTTLPESEKDRRLLQLERESAASRDYLQSTLQEHETVKEELKSAHEEVLSANEEFQSTNEELETAKEELQSANEELTTTNDELGSRNRELSVLNAELQKARQISDHAREYAEVIVETVREPLLVLDGELRVQRANHAFYTDFKTRREDVEGHIIYDLGDGQWNNPLLRKRLLAVLGRNEPMDAHEISRSVATIGERILSLNARKIPGDGERAESILLAIEDVTAQHAATDILRNDGRRKDEFLAMLAHELRTPLAPIAHAVHLLRQGNADGPSTRLHLMIERQTQRLARLVSDLLDIARISRGQIELKREWVDLGALAQHAADATGARIERQMQELVLNLPANPIYVNGDPIRLEQIVLNLLENAAKYTDPGGRISLSLEQQGDEAILKVRDNGIGLAPEMLHSIFDLFTQVNGSLARSGGGLGIGLNLVRQVLELHGGRIEAHSAGLGQGTEFVVHLPGSHQRAVATPIPSLQVSIPAKAIASTARRVLIVDDNRDSADSMSMLAQSWGHEAVVANDGPAALIIATSFRPDIAVVDIGLPGMDGYEVARRLRKGAPDRKLYLLAMTGYGRPADRQLALDAGFDEHLVKPADLEQLERMLAAAGARS